MANEASINREILRLAIPNIISNVSVPLLSTVDTALMGRLSAAHIGAVGLASMLFNFIYWNFGFLRMGTTGMTAQAFGSRDSQAIRMVLGRSLMIALTLALLVVVFQNGLLKAGLLGLQVPQEQVNLVSQYFGIRIWAAPATLVIYALLGWYFGMQNAMYPLIITIVINLLNMVLSYSLVHYSGWAIRGVAWGTLLAQYLGVILAVALLVTKYGSEHLRFRFRDLIHWPAFSGFLRINGNLFIRTVCLTFAFAYFYAQSAHLDPVLLAVNVILLQLLNWLSYAVDGFAFAAESLVGKYYGAKDSNTLPRVIWLSFLWGGIIALGFALLYGLAGPLIFRIYTDQQEVLAAGGEWLLWMAALPLLSFASYIWDGIFIGLTASRAMRDTMLLALSFFLLVHQLWLKQFAWGLWLAFLLFMVARGAFQTMVYFRQGGRLAKIPD